MKPVDVLETVNQILDLGVSENDAERERLSQSILSCCNFVLEDLCRNYCSDRRTVVEAKEGFIDLSDLGVCNVKSLIDTCGDSVPFRHTENGLLVGRDGRFNLTYAKLPNQLDYADEIVLPNCLLTYRIFIYGVIAEYLRRTGDYLKSASWKDKFDTAIRAAASNKTCASLPRRRWLS